MLFLNSVLLVLAVFLSPPHAGAQYLNSDPLPYDETEDDLRDEAAQLRGGEVYEDYASFPTYISLSDTIHDFRRFADGGPDANWYIGFNNAWIVKLPAAPPGEYQRAFIGAKIGRAKTRPRRGRRWESEPIPGKIYLGINQRPSFPSDRRYFLVETKDIPLEANRKRHVAGVGASEWFWKEVPIGVVSFSQPNYLIVWSPTRSFRDAAHSPILAAADNARTGKGIPQAWNNHSLKGVPPRDARETLQVPINFKPALAIKLIPASDSEVTVSDFLMRPRRDDMIIQFSAEGRNIDSAWVEMARDKLNWRRVSKIRRRPPFIFRIPRKLVPPRGAHFRGRASDILAAEGASPSVFLPGEGVR